MNEWMDVDVCCLREMMVFQLLCDSMHKNVCLNGAHCSLHCTVLDVLIYFFNFSLFQCKCFF